MPFAFIAFGVLFTVSGITGNGATLLALLKNDLVGKGSYLYWLLAIIVLGSLGYVDSLRPFSKAMMILVLLVLLLAEDKATGGGFFSQFQSALSGIATGNSKQGA